MVYIFAPAKSVSGGPELSQQLCHTLNSRGIKAEMVYFFSWLILDPAKDVAERYKGYGNPYTKHIKDTRENVLIVPETALYWLSPFRKAKKYIWWMSVNNYYWNFTGWKHRICYLFGLLDKPLDKLEACHLCQSYYAKKHLLDNHVKEERIAMLSDYLNKEFIQNASAEKAREKEDIVLYNPKKGLAFTQQLIEKGPDIRWVPIQNMTPAEIRELMQKSKLYIDFGDHPGKDRLPREAAISGCCIITGRKGAARNGQDIQIPQHYKLEQGVLNVPAILDKIRYVLKNYDTCRADFDPYREKIRGEEKEFEREVDSIFGSLKA